MHESGTERQAQKPLDRAPAERLNDIFLIVGRLNYAWSNTETLLIHLIAGLAKVDKETATIIFLTLNTPRARFDLVERLAKAGRIPTPDRDEILRLTRQLAQSLRVRNHYNHCIYSVDAQEKSAKTILMRIQDRKDSIKIGKIYDFDLKEISRIRSEINNIEEINKELWSYIISRKYPL